MTSQARAEIAEAVNYVDGLTCHAYYVASTAPGAAHVRLDRIEYPNTFGGVAHWQVVVLLPQDLASAEKYLETRLTSLLTALNNVAVVTAVQVERLDISGTGVLPAAVITAHREA